MALKVTSVVGRGEFWGCDTFLALVAALCQRVLEAGGGEVSSSMPKLVKDGGIALGKDLYRPVPENQMRRYPTSLVEPI